jgi:hypothetical protein
MRYFLLALFLVGCGESNNWTVRLGEETAPKCTGYMTLDDKGQGDWACFPYGGEAHADFLRVPGTVYYDLETKPGFLNRVRATGDGQAVDGIMILDDVEVAFHAAIDPR